MEAEIELNELKKHIVERIKEEVQDAQLGEEVYFHDIIHEEVDAFLSYYDGDREALIKFIDFCGNEDFADKGVLDFSSLDRILITLAYECIYNWLFEDERFQKLQDLLNNYEITQEIKEKIKEIRVLPEF